MKDYRETGKSRSSVSPYRISNITMIILTLFLIIPLSLLGEGRPMGESHKHLDLQKVDYIGLPTVALSVENS